MFKNSSGMWLLQALFLELSYTRQDHIIYTLRDEDYEYNGKQLVSLKKRYLECADPTEYKFAKQWLGGWQHWKLLSESPPMRPHVAEWREELEVLLRSEGVLSLIKDATSANKSAATSAKWLAERGWVKRSAGRPTKDVTDKTKKDEVKVSAHIKDDAERLGLRLV